MPTYAYACADCGHRFEVRQSFSDSALNECPQCSGAVRKLFNTVGIVFKGSGFYRTDSRTTNGSGGKGETAGAKADSSTSESSGAAKPSEKKAADKKPAASSAPSGSAA